MTLVCAGVMAMTGIDQAAGRDAVAAQAGTVPAAAAANESAPAASAANAGQSPPATAVPSPGANAAAVPGLAVGTPLQLMLLTEVTSRTAHAGDRFKLRVNEAIVLDGVTVVPVGTLAWGEVVTQQANGAAGKSGRLGAQLLYLDMPTGRVPLEGKIARKGDGNAGGVLMAVVGFGVFGLLAQGDSARLRAGDIFIGTVARSFPPEPAAVNAPAAQPAAAH
ncbi:hypothetical protein [Sphingomonas sp. R3G8C]|uniref:hypothetical protein n=1 Tax=Novosphingobium rhizosphaerae TaxID=1551649 RepID=UPI001C544A13